MPRSRTTSPVPPGADISNSFVPGVTLTPNTPERNQSSITSATSTSSPLRKKQKYMKPRIGITFQAKVEPFSASLAKSTIELRESEKKKGPIGGYRSHNSESVVGGEYWGGGLFASSSTAFTNGGYCFGGGTSSSWNGTGRRKKAGRPPKNGRGAKVSLFNNDQPIYYDADIKPPSGGLCIHRPIQSMREDNAKSGDEHRKQSHSAFLTYARNIILQGPTSKEINQSQSQFSNKNLSTFSYQRIQFLFNEVVARYDTILNANSQSKQDDDIQLGRKRKAGSISSSSDSLTLNTSSVCKSTASNTTTPVSTSSNQSHNSLDSNICTTQQIEQKNRVSNRKRTQQAHVLGLEDDEQFLEYLEQSHNGNIQRANFYMLSHLCQGRAVKTRRYMKKMKKEDEMNVPLSAVLAPLSDSWRRRYGRMGTTSTILGDHRTMKSGNEYPFFDVKKEQNKYTNDHGSRILEQDKAGQAELSHLNPWTQSYITKSIPKMDEKSNKEGCNPTSCGDIDLEGFENDPRFVNDWKLILGIGKQIALQLGQSPSNPEATSHAVKLKDILIILARAYSMPKPEEVFGRRDSISKQVSQCLNIMLDNVDIARGVIAHITDAMHNENEEGIDIKKLAEIVESKSSKCPLHIEEVEIVQQMLKEAEEWQLKLSIPALSENEDDVDSNISENLNLPQQSLANAEELAFSGRSLSLRPQSLCLLDDRIQRAYELRNRIREWTTNKNNSNDKDSVKYVAAMIKEANEINLGFPELSVLSKVHKDAEEWVDRASVAMRSKISLHELEQLVNVGQKLPLGLSGTLDKLTGRFDEACSWISKLIIEVPSPLENMNATGSNLHVNHLIDWLRSMLQSLKSNHGQKIDKLNNLASEGLRLPVEINILQLLQIAIDSKNWSSKAESWLPSSGTSFKRGKIDDLRDHIDLAETIVGKVETLTEGTCKWNLDYYDDINDMVQKGENWYEKYQEILENDNRRIHSKCVMNFAKLKEIVDSADAIDVNLGAPYVKVSRMYSEAKSWTENFRFLLVNCGITVSDNQSGTLPSAQSGKVSLEQAIKAIEAASNDLSVELLEVNKLKALVGQSQDWFDRAIQFAPKRNKRITKGKKDSSVKRSMVEIIELIDNAVKIPMDTTEELERLRMLLSDVQSWRLQAQVNLREISSAFDILREERNSYYGTPTNFLKELDSCSNLEDEATKELDRNFNMTQRSDQNSSGINQNESNDISKSPVKNMDSGGKDVYKMISTLIKSAEAITINSFEEEISHQLGITSKWCKKVAVLIGSHTDVYTNRRWKKDLDSLISEGENLGLSDALAATLTEHDIEEKKLLRDVNTSVSMFISNDIERLKILRFHMDTFHSWCDKVSKAYSEADKKIPLEALKSLADESSLYPQSAETVKQIRNDASSAVSWANAVGEIISSGSKISLIEAKTKLDAGNRLKFTCREYKELKKSYQAAKAWSKRVNKCGLDEGSAQIYKIKELIREHDSLLITMPEEIDALKSAMCSYCICRRPYEGFMIGCDECEDWFHGSCIGISQAQGHRIEKYLCIRCCVKKVHRSSSSAIATVIRKWCDEKELSKSRSQDAQKHQRKIREKKREVMKWKEDLQTNVDELREFKAEEIRQLNLTSDLHPAPVDMQTSSPLSPKITEINGNIVKATTTLEQCNRKLEELAAFSKARKALHEKEDSMQNHFRYWCLQLRSKLLTPDTIELAEKSRPTPSPTCKIVSELLSKPMSEMISLASKYGLGELPDTKTVKNCLECICWSHLALSILKRRPTLEEIKTLLDLSSQLKLPEIKSVGMMRSMVSRTVSWQVKVTKALIPTDDGSKNKCNVTVLNDLRTGMNGTPLFTNQETLLMNVIENGVVENCSNNEAGVDFNDVSPHAPDPLQLWPPFGLSNSAESLKELGILPLTLKCDLKVQAHSNRSVLNSSDVSLKFSNSTTINGTSQPPTKPNVAVKSHNTNIQLKLNTKNGLHDLKLHSTPCEAKSANSKSTNELCSILNTNQVAADAVAAALSVDPQIFVDPVCLASTNAVKTDNMNVTVNDGKNMSKLDDGSLINAKEVVEVAVKAALASSGILKPDANQPSTARTKVISLNKTSIGDVKKPNLNVQSNPSQAQDTQVTKICSPGNKALLNGVSVNKTNSTKIANGPYILKPTNPQQPSQAKFNQAVAHQKNMIVPVLTTKPSTPYSLSNQTSLINAKGACGSLIAKSVTAPNLLLSNVEPIAEPKKTATVTSLTQANVKNIQKFTSQSVLNQTSSKASTKTSSVSLNVKSINAQNKNTTVSDVTINPSTLQLLTKPALQATEKIASDAVIANSAIIVQRTAHGSTAEHSTAKSPTKLTSEKQTSEVKPPQKTSVLLKKFG